ncbi:hypothetical protein ACS0TY_027058 [Phlomoides rotata]
MPEFGETNLETFGYIKKLKVDFFWQRAFGFQAAAFWKCMNTALVDKNVMMLLSRCDLASIPAETNLLIKDKFWDKITTEPLIRKVRGVKVVGQAIGHGIAWSKHLVKVEDTR